MTASPHHPAGHRLRPRCTAGGCHQPAQARVAYPQLPQNAGVPGLGFVIVRPPDSPGSQGDLVCLGCAHAAVDVMLMRARPEPTR